MGVMDRIRAWWGRVFGATGYEGATTSRRGDGFRGITGAADDVAYWDVHTIRERSRSLCRNHWAAKRAKAVLVSKIVGQGILPSSKDPALNAYLRLWNRPQGQVGAEYGQSLLTVQRLVCNSVVESGSCLVVRNWRTKRQMAERGLVTPFQLAVLDPEFLDSTRDGTNANGNVVVGGVEYDATGWAVAYWIYDEHPNTSLRPMTLQSRRVRASDVAHVYWAERPGQTIGVPWFASVLLKLKDYDEYEDAQLVRQKIAAMFALFVTTSNPDKEAAVADDLVLEPGRVQFLQSGESIESADPPTVVGYEEFSRINLRSIAAGLGLSYEDLSNDYSQVNFSSARMGALVTRTLLDQWQTEMMIGLLCQRLDQWLLEAVTLLGIEVGDDAEIRWTAPRRELLDPSREVGAIERAIAAGLTSRQEEVRKLGRDIETVDAERLADRKREEELGLAAPAGEVDEEPATMAQIRGLFEDLHAH